MTATNLNTNIDQVLRDYHFLQNPYFVNLANGEMSKMKFIQTQHQFYYAVVHFISPLALVAASIPTYQERLLIIKNLWEEHGEGDINQTHGATFTEFIKRLTGEENITINQAQEAVTLFNESLDGICKSVQFLRGVAAIGIIERMFADISSHIGTQVVARGWMKQSEMIHYSVHKELDCIHAEDFFSILRPYYESEANKQVIQDGLRLGALTFMQLYSNLWERARRG